MIDIVYDMDEVLNNFNAVVMKLVGCPMPNRFSIKEATNLTDEQKQKILQAYADPVVFSYTNLVDGAADIIKPENEGKARVWINSMSYHESIRDIKLIQLRETIPDMNPERICLQLTTNTSVVTPKAIIPQTGIIVEDCYKNLCDYSKDVIKILIDKPYNQAGNYPELQYLRNVIRVTNLLEANATISRILERIFS